jgi:hypothetical protein
MGSRSRVGRAGRRVGRLGQILRPALRRVEAGTGRDIHPAEPTARTAISSASFASLWISWTPRGCSTSKPNSSPTPSAWPPTPPKPPSLACCANTTPAPTTKPASCCAKSCGYAGDIHIDGYTLHGLLDPTTAPRRTRAITGLCHDLTATQTRYPGTNLKLHYGIKTPQQRSHSCQETRGCSASPSAPVKYTA